MTRIPGSLKKSAHGSRLLSFRANALDAEKSSEPQCQLEEAIAKYCVIVPPFMLDDVFCNAGTVSNGVTYVSVELAELRLVADGEEKPRRHTTTSTIKGLYKSSKEASIPPPPNLFQNHLGYFSNRPHCPLYPHQAHWNAS